MYLKKNPKHNEKTNTENHHTTPPSNFCLCIHAIEGRMTLTTDCAIWIINHQQNSCWA